jgi:hypothetical protein
LLLMELKIGQSIEKKDTLGFKQKKTREFYFAG